jgi:PAS domain S-box-containing protein
MYRNLQASEQEFRTLAENLPDVLVRYDREGRRTYVNRALEQTFPVTAKQLIGKTLAETNAAGMQMPETYRRALEHTLATGERSELEMQLPSSHENMGTGLCFIVAERVADGQITGAISVARDITERKRNEAELERHRNHLEKLVEDRTHALSIAKETAEAATRAKSRFLAAASHDLRQPISAIGLYNDALALSGLNEGQKRMSLNLTRSVESLGEMLNELLDIAKLDAGKLVPQPAVIQSGELLGMIASEFDSVALEKHLSLNLFCPRRDLALFTDKNLLLTILRNLIGNAVKYTIQGGILVSIRQRDNRALIQVWDTGIGIAPEQLDLIFEEYFQAGNFERNRAKGAGLGLAIVKRVSEALGNRVSCRSRLGSGSVFEISLPLA